MNRSHLDGYAVYRRVLPSGSELAEWAYWRTDEMQGMAWRLIEFDSVWPTQEGAAQRCRDLTAMVSS